MFFQGFHDQSRAFFFPHSVSPSRENILSYSVSSRFGQKRSGKMHRAPGERLGYFDEEKGGNNRKACFFHPVM